MIQKKFLKDAIQNPEIISVVGGLIGISSFLKQDNKKVIDFNDCDFGIYYIGDNGLESTDYFTATPNAPKGAYRYGTLLSVKRKSAFQIYFPIQYSSAGKKVYFRSMSETNSWQVWRYITLTDM